MSQSLRTLPRISRMLLSAIGMATLPMVSAMAQAEPSKPVRAAAALAALPDATADRLREALSSQDSLAIMAVQAKVAALREELRHSADFDSMLLGTSVNGGKSAAVAHPPKSALQGRRIAAERTEFAELRRQVLAELHDLEQRTLAVAGNAAAAKVAALATQADQRFTRLDQALAQLESPKDTVFASRARENLGRLLAPAPGESVPSKPIPTLSALPPIGREPGESGIAARPPSYVQLDQGPGMRHADRGDAPGFGFVKAAAVLRPPAPDTGLDCGAGLADLADDGVEVRLTPEIRELAQNLQYSPVRILRWMQLNVKFKPYWGSLKGAVGTLQTREGNSTDQASLLIALLRASNVPARYVRGTVAVADPQPANSPTGRAQRWLGTKNYSASIAYLNQGVPAGQLVLNGTAQGLTMDHVWAQACVPFSSYRGGFSEASGYRWVPMDPAFRDAEYQAGLAVNVPLDGAFYSGYLASRSAQLPPDYFADKSEQAARGVRADASLVDIPYSGRPKSPRMDVLPGALPHMVIRFTAWPGGSSAETAAIPPEHRHRFTVQVKASTAGAALASTTVSLPQGLQGRLTLSYQPDAASQALWNAWGGSLQSLPAGAVRVSPVLTLDGTVQATGSSTLALGAGHVITMKLVQGEKTVGSCIADSGVMTDPKDPDASCLNKTVYEGVKAGGFYALGFNGGQATSALLDSRADKLADAVQANPSAPTPAAGAAYDSTVGELLHLVLQQYIHDTEQADRRIAELRGYLSAGLYDIGLTGSEIKTDYLFDLPLTVKPAGAYVDFKGGTYSFVLIDTAADFSANRAKTLEAEQKDLAKLSIYSNSALEHHVWQQALRTDAVSTVRGLQYASETGVTLVTLSAANIGSYDSLMQMSGPGSMAAYKSLLQREVQQGATVTVPRAQIAYADAVDPSKAWRGVVYMSENATLGVYGAIINGSISGGFPLLNSTPVKSVFAPNAQAPSFLSQTGSGGPVWLASAGKGLNQLMSIAGDPVNLLNGNLIHDHTDLAVKGRGLPIVLQRWYNGAASGQDGPLGHGWTHSFHHQLRLYGVEGGLAKLGWIAGNGSETFFSTASHSGGDIARGAVLSGSPGSSSELSRVSGGADDGKFRIRERDGSVYLFASAVGPAGVPAPGASVVAKLLSITDRNGNSLSLNYSGEQLASVVDGLGRQVLTFTWSGGRIERVTDFSGRKVSYAYTDGTLTQYTDALSQAHRYTYYGASDGPKLNRLLKRFVHPRGNGMEFEYYSGGQVFRHTPFGVDGKLISESSMSFHYNLFNKEAWTLNERGHERRHSFDAYGNPVRIVDEAGGVHQYSYDPAKPYNRLSATDPVGRRTSYSYNAADLLETVTLPSGATLEYRDYNAFAQPQRVKDARGNWRWMRYDARGNLTDSIVLRAGVAGVAGTQPAPADIVAWHRTSFDASGNPVTLTRVKDFSAGTGPSLTRNWDANRLNVLSLGRSGNRSGKTVNETSSAFSYDSLNRLTAGVDRRWYPTSQTHDALDRPIQTSDGLGQPRKLRYDGNGNLIETELMGAGGARLDSQVFSYDGQDRLIRTLDGAGNLRSVAYDAAGNPVARTSADNFTLSTEFDELNRPVAAFDAEDNRVFTQLDAVGRVLSVTDPNGNAVAYQYWGPSNFDGRLRRITQPVITGQSRGRALEFEYDAQGNAIRTTVIAADGSSTRQSHQFYDELGRVVRSLGAPDDEGKRLQVCTRFDSLGNATEIWAGPTTDTIRDRCDFADAGLKLQLSQSWDDFGQRLSRTDPLGRVWRYGYDFYGNLAFSQSPEQAKRGLKTDYFYDSKLFGTLSARRVPAQGSSGGQEVSWTRNALGQVTRAETSDAGGNLLLAYDYAYDAAQRLVRIGDSRGGKTLIYRWTPGGRLAGVSLADDAAAAAPTHRWDFKYDGVGRLSAIVAPNGQTLTITLDPAGRLRERTLEGSGLTSRYSWFADGSLQAISHQQGSTVLASSSYGYDLWGNRQTLSQRSGGATDTWSYGYDALNRLKKVGNGNAAQEQGFAFDLFGNRIERTLGSPVTQRWTSSFDAAHQLQQIQQVVGTVGITLAQLWDDNGNLVKSCDAGTGGSVSATAGDCSASGGSSHVSNLAWDGLEQLVSLIRSGTGAVTEAYAYDDTGRRVRKTSGAAVTHYLYQGEDIAAEWSGALPMLGAPAAVYAHGADRDEPLLRLSGAASGTPQAQTVAYLSDGLGSIVAGLNEARVATEARADAISASGSVDEAAFPSAGLIDGDPLAGAWQGNASSSSITLELGAQGQRLNRVKLWRAMGLSADTVVRNASVSLRGLDGQWRAVASLTNNSSQDSPELSFTAQSASAVRVDFTAARNGSVVALAEVGLSLDAANAGTLVQRFDAWGQLLSASGGAIPVYGYTGREPDASGLMFYRARYYQPGTGRFASRDPLGLAGGINPYAYADGNPVLFNDPDGLLATQAGNYVTDYAGRVADRLPGWWEERRDRIDPTRNPMVQASGTGLASLAATAVGLATGDQALIDIAADGARGTGLSTADGVTMAMSLGLGGRSAPVGKLRASGQRDAHHTIQDAAVRDLPGYNTNAAPGVQLQGPANAPGTPHYHATNVQRQAGGGTYGAERRIGYKALRRGGLAEPDARALIQEADNYFGSIGVTPVTATRIPGNRSNGCC